MAHSPSASARERSSGIYFESGENVHIRYIRLVLKLIGLPVIGINGKSFEGMGRKSLRPFFSLFLCFLQTEYPQLSFAFGFEGVSYMGGNCPETLKDQTIFTSHIIVVIAAGVEDHFQFRTFCRTSEHPPFGSFTANNFPFFQIAVLSGILQFIERTVGKSPCFHR